MKNKDLKYYVNLYCKDFDFIVMSKICSGIDLPYTNPNPELLFSLNYKYGQRRRI